MNWFETDQSLPTEGDAVQFLLLDREIVIDGSYAQHAFRSRWSEYCATRVSRWRPKDPAPLAPTPEDRY